MKIKFHTILVIVALSSFLTACNEKEAKTVQWYNEHKQERAAQIKICKNDPGKLRNDPDCVNAMQSLRTNSGGYID